MSDRIWPYPDIPQRCTCAGEDGLCAYCEVIEHEEQRNLLNDLHDADGPFSVCPRAACLSTDIDVGPGETARCNSCGVRW